MCIYIPIVHSYELRFAGGSVSSKKKNLTSLYEMPSLPRGMAKLATKPLPYVTNISVAVVGTNPITACKQQDQVVQDAIVALRIGIVSPGAPCFPISISTSPFHHQRNLGLIVAFPSNRAQDVDSCLSAIQDAIVALRTSQTSSRLDPNSSNPFLRLHRIGGQRLRS